jgi:tRNA nucleotidyltransferase (CCA-adding enzyme)
VARAEGTYTDGRRPDKVIPGRLIDDLRRRDFTMNAIAKDSTGNLIDPFNGREDIQRGLIRAVGNAEDRISEDALRGLRAIRFAVTKGFFIHKDINRYLRTTKFRESLKSVSQDRVREEMHKAFKHDTVLTLDYLDRYGLLHTIFANGLWLEPTTKS